jgi:hypothetical protein
VPNAQILVQFLVGVRSNHHSDQAVTILDERSEDDAVLTLGKERKGEDGKVREGEEVKSERCWQRSSCFTFLVGVDSSNHHSDQPVIILDGEV